MRLSRLKHSADTISAMFTGWQMQEISKFKEWGGGIFEANILSQECFVNDGAVESLDIIEIINTWLLEDLEKHNIPLEVIENARLKAAFSYNHKKTKGGILNILEIECTSEVCAYERVYKSKGSSKHKGAF